MPPQILSQSCLAVKGFCQTSLKVGFFLAVRQLKRTSKWTTILIIFIMMFTFLNLVVVSGILVGLVEGSSRAYREQYSGDIFITKPANKVFIEKTQEILNIAGTIDHVKAYTLRYLQGGQLEANYRTKTNPNDLPDRVPAQIVGINPQEEDKVTKLSQLVVAGNYLEPDDEGQVLVGSTLLAEYSRGVPGLETLANVSVGSRVRVLVGGITKEVTVKGVVKSKIGEVGRRVYFVDRELRKILSRLDFNGQEISFKIGDDATPEHVKESFLASGIDPKNVLVQTWEESQGQFFKDIGSTFSILGTAIGSIALVVASITIFIVIFINAVTRRKFIGILKGIGICSSAIQISYLIQSIFYALVGTVVGSAIIFLLLKPYIDANPIDFPFSDGLLVAPLNTTMWRAGILLLITLIAGYLPARMIIKKNTLDSILGR